MSPEQLLQSLQSRQPVLSTRVIDATLNVEVERESLRDLLRILRDELHFDFLTFLTALDRIEENRLAVVYRLFSYATKAAVVVRVSLPRDAARLDTVHDIYRTAEWHERETAEMSGPASGGALMPDPVSPPAATLPSPPTTSDEFLAPCAWR